MAIPISACVMCKNEAATIVDALNSLAWADEILVVDSGSTDGTVELIRTHPAKPRLIETGWPGYNAQRQFMVSQCRHPWIFMLDADEECSIELAAEMKALQEETLTQTGIASMPRRNYLAGRYVRCWSPDLQSRLIHRERVAWNETSQFDTWKPKPGYSARPLLHPILHCRTAPTSLADFNDAPVMADRAALMSEHLFNRGKRATFFNLLLRPLLTFFKFYLIRGSFLDGRFGLVVAYKSTVGVMLKYSTLYSRELLSERKPK